MTSHETRSLAQGKPPDRTRNNPRGPTAPKQLGGASFRAIGTQVSVLTADPTGAAAAETMLRHELARLDETCSRFRSSELNRLHAHEGSWVEVSPLLAELLQAALDVARFTRGAVDPTVGSALIALGYHDDFDAIDRDDPRPRAANPVPAPGWQSIEFDPLKRRVRIPPAIRIDLGSSAKALAADRTARKIATQLSCGVLVNLGGDVAMTGEAADGGWQVGIDLDARTSPADVDLVVALHSGGLASSGTRVRNWRRGGEPLHHIIDPRTGDVAHTRWALATVASSTCLYANAASTAAIVMGTQATDWLRAIGYPARLIDQTGAVTVLGGWPDDPPRNGSHRSVAADVATKRWTGRCQYQPGWALALSSAEGRADL